MMSTARRVFSGVQPTGVLHLGNYLGALMQWAANQDDYDNIFCVVDLHALTVPETIDPKVLHAKIREVAGLYVAAGVDPDKATIFVQSRVSEHAELTWILNCVTPVGWLERMTQYKAKSQAAQSIGTGLLDYPVLMAADILLYDTAFVPVGDDQRQHIELARDVAARFNHMFGEAFVIPEPLIRRSGARIMGLDDPTGKMSKSTAAGKAGHAVGLLDPPNVIRKAIMRAATDSGNDIRFDTAGPGVANLLAIYETLSGEPREKIEKDFDGKGYGHLKRTVADQVIAALEPLQRRYAELTADPATIEDILTAGAERARPIAAATLDRVRNLTGLG
jgi:tryptophanyl-tRNA synthetase